MNNLTGEKMTKSLGIKRNKHQENSFIPMTVESATCILFAWISALMDECHYTEIAVQNETHYLRQQQAFKTICHLRWPRIFVASRSVNVWRFISLIIAIVWIWIHFWHLWHQFYFYVLINLWKLWEFHWDFAVSTKSTSANILSALSNNLHTDFGVQLEKRSLFHW